MLPPTGGLSRSWWNELLTQLILTGSFFQRMTENMDYLHVKIVCCVNCSVCQLKWEWPVTGRLSCRKCHKRTQNSVLLLPPSQISGWICYSIALTVTCVCVVCDVDVRLCEVNLLCLRVSQLCFSLSPPLRRLLRNVFLTNLLYEYLIPQIYNLFYMHTCICAL